MVNKYIEFELQLILLFAQIMVKKTRPERPEKPLPPGPVAAAAAATGGLRGAADPPESGKFNPYMVKEVPDRPANNAHEPIPLAKVPVREKPKISRWEY